MFLWNLGSCQSSYWISFDKIDAAGMEHPILVLTSVLLCASILPRCTCISRDGLALLAFKNKLDEDPHEVLSNWNSLDEHPCNWSGVACKAFMVVTVNIPGSSLKGQLAPELALVTSLRILNLHSNQIHGTIPKEYGQLKSLRILDLSSNQLSGAIPNELGQLSSISKILLEDNELVGIIPLELGDLKMLEELRLQRNKLHGNIPGDRRPMNLTLKPDQYYNTVEESGLCRLKKLKMANFSYNLLIGKVPTCLKYLPRSSFEWNCLQDNTAHPHQHPPEQCGQMHLPEHSESQIVYRKNHRTKHQWLLPLEAIMGSVVAIIFLLAIFAILRHRTKEEVMISWKKLLNRNEQRSLISDIQGLTVPVMRREDLEVACEDFSNIIGSSPDSIVYKGITKQGLEIAVTSMRIAKEDWNAQLEHSFRAKVEDLAKLNHSNVVRLLGYCAENEPFARMLVFEYTSNGTLYEHIHYGDPGQLIWTARMKIIVGVAHALQYLHHELESPVALLNLDSNAVYLTEDYCPKLANFEIRKSIASNTESYWILKSTATPMSNSHSNVEEATSDIDLNIFSYGVLLLEIITGRFAYSKEQGCLIDWAQEYLDVPEVISYLVDPSLRYFRYSDLQTICELVLLCTNPDSSKRPSMRQIVSMLEAKLDTSSFDVVEHDGYPLTWAEFALYS